MAGALAGLKIVEVGTMVSAPYAAKLMADMGAEVIKVETPVSGDPARNRGHVSRSSSKHLFYSRMKN